MIRDESSGALLGRSLGAGLGEGIEGLIQNKLQEIQQSKFSGLLQKAGYDEPTSQLLTQIQQQNPNQFMDIIKLLGAGTEQQNPVGVPTQQNQPQTFANKIAKGTMAGSDAKHRAQIEKEKASHFKETRVERKELFQKAKAAKENISDLNRLEELEKEGKVDDAAYIEFLKGSGLDIPALTEPGTQEFNKIVANFLRGAKETFGSRISNYEVEQFLKTLPNLSQSPEGRKRVIANLKRINRGAIEYYNAMRDVVKENGGIPPYDLLEKIDDKIEPRLEKIAQQFKNDVERPVPPAPNKLKIALGSALGGVIGAPGKIIGKAASLGSSLLGGLL